jgi:serine/threonine protein kinase
MVHINVNQHVCDLPWLDLPPFQRVGDSAARWRKVKTLHETPDGAGKVLCVVNQRPQDGLGLPEMFAVKVKLKAKLPGSLGRPCCSLANAVMAPFAVTTYGAWQDERHIYMTMEYCATVDEAMASGKLPLRVAVCRDVARKVLSALRIMHIEGIYHPRLQLSHLLVSTDGSIKLAGLTLMHQSGAMSTKMMKFDIFRLGAVLWALLFGSHPPVPCRLAPSQDASTEFLAWLMNPDFALIPSAEDALNHPWLSQDSKATSTAASSITYTAGDDVDCECKSVSAPFAFGPPASSFQCTRSTDSHPLVSSSPLHDRLADATVMQAPSKTRTLLQQLDNQDCFF